MSENNKIKDMKLDESMLDEVSGGVGAASVGVRDINPYWGCRSCFCRRQRH